MNHPRLAINVHLVAYVCGLALAFQALILGLTAGLAAFLADGTAPAFGASALAAAAAGGLLTFGGRRQRSEISDIRGRDGLAVVGLTWPLILLAGALPYSFSGQLPSFADALFESVSGFTTTGASVFVSLDRTPPTILLWRALTHWLGGMGVIVLMLAVLPFLGVRGVHLFRNESSLGQVRLRPRIAQTATALWLIYLVFTAALVILARACGLPWFEALCLGLSLFATGGFAPRDLSIAHYGQPGLEIVCIFFMLAASLNFALYYQAFRGDWRGLVRDAETRVFFSVVLLAGLALAASLLSAGLYPSAGTALRHAFLQVVSVVSTTGLVSADWSQWPNLARGLLFGLFFLGGCTGSTSGGVKCARWILIFKSLHRALRQHIHPRAVIGLSLGGRPVPERLMTAVWSFGGLYVVVLAASTLILAALNLDLLTALAASASALGNVGLDLGGGFAHLPGLAKGVLMLEMLLGRLEFFTILILFHPEFWTR